LNAWIDFNRDGDFADSGEHVIADRFLAHAAGLGSNTLPDAINVPPLVNEGLTFARFRVSDTAETPPDYFGAGGVGEVEDYQVLVIQTARDFGDAPGPYPTSLAQNGARHKVGPDYYLGSSIDLELDAQPNATATGDDLGFLDDEDGVLFGATDPADPSYGTLKSGAGSWVYVTASRDGYVNAWIDLNRDNDWNDAGELLFENLPVLAGQHGYAVQLPAGLTAGDTFARFRYTSGAQASPAYTGEYPDGAVVDGS